MSETSKKPVKMNAASMAELGRALALQAPSPTLRAYRAAVAEVKPPVVMDGAAPKKHIQAMDALNASLYEMANTAANQEGFIGFPLLGALTQRPEYRALTCTLAAEMVREWVKFRSVGKSDKSAQIKTIEDALKRHGVRKLFQSCAEYDGFYGRCQLYIDTGKGDEPKELKTPLHIAPAKVPRGSLRGFRLIEPIVTYPNYYNSDDALSPHYYRPDSWFVLSKEVHSTRLLTFISRPLSNYLKPAYNFAGLSMTQMAIPYVENWIQTRESVNRLISNFSTSGIKSNMADVLQGGAGANLMLRAQLFAQFRDNQGVMLLDKDSEEFFQFNIPLSGLDKLQAQAQEHMASVGRIPLVILLGISPAGLNASSEGEIRVFYDYVAAQQEALFRKNLEAVVQIIQLDEFGAVDPDIVFDFEPLYQVDAATQATIQKSKADAGVGYIAAGVLTPEEERERLAKDPDSGYDALTLVPDDPLLGVNLEDPEALAVGEPTGPRYEE